MPQRSCVMTYKLLSIAYIILTLNYRLSTQASRLPATVETFSMRNKILRSANAKYHYSFLFFYKMNKGDFSLMCSCVLWCEFIDVLVFFFFGYYCLTPVTLFIIRSKGSTEKQPVVRTLSTRRRFAARKPIKSQIFSTRGKLLPSLHRSKSLKAKYLHACCWK